MPRAGDPLNSRIEAGVAGSVSYLSSDAAQKSLGANPYWPKWDSPWWHMVALREMGLAHLIPRVAVERLVRALQKQYPADGNFFDTTPCPCELGNIYQVIASTEIDPDEALPWARAWLLGRQMPDGGLSCDDSAYEAKPPASSIVGTIAALEAILLCTKRPFTAGESRFLDAGARCLIERGLMHATSAPHNEEEKADEADWLLPAFPRFYFYDVLRGLSFLLKWADLRNQKIPADSVARVLAELARRFPDGQVRVGRRAHESVGSRVRVESGEWKRSPSASRFPLLEALSEVGEVSPALTAEWASAQARLSELKARGLI